MVGAPPSSAQAPPAPAGQGWSLSPAAAPPLTVADLIGLASFGSHVQGDGREDESVLSPDGARVAVVVKRGNLAHNTVEFTLLLFHTALAERA